MAKWISVKKRMPKEHDSVFAPYYGTPKWQDSMFKKHSDDVWVVIEVENGGRFISTTNTRDGVWILSSNPKTCITHWMSIPELPEEARTMADMGCVVLSVVVVCSFAFLGWLVYLLFR